LTERELHFLTGKTGVKVACMMGCVCHSDGYFIAP